jgi:hypothetical protein
MASSSPKKLSEVSARTLLNDEYASSKQSRSSTGPGQRRVSRTSQSTYTIVATLEGTKSPQQVMLAILPVLRVEFAIGLQQPGQNRTTVIYKMKSAQILKFTGRSKECARLFLSEIILMHEFSKYNDCPFSGMNDGNKCSKAAEYDQNDRKTERTMYLRPRQSRRQKCSRHRSSLRGYQLKGHEFSEVRLHFDKEVQA